jgi:hypothetical protein
MNEFDVDIQAYKKFQSRFSVYFYDNMNDVNNIIMKNGITHLFIEKAGDKDGIWSNKCKNIIHCVFTTAQPHGHVYIPIGNTINNLYNTKYPVLPYMVTLPEINETLRDILEIPNKAIVFGRYGGKESFDILFVHDVIKKILEVRKDVYFLFMNTSPFYQHPNIIYIDGTSDMIYKRKFINTCDALLHARNRGETFGLTCGEFSICKKPVITWANSRENEHLSILKEKAVLYRNPFDLYNIINTFTKNKYNVNENGYMFYTPENVMNIFNKICLLT